MIELVPHKRTDGGKREEKEEKECEERLREAASWGAGELEKQQTGEEFQGQRNFFS